MKHALLPKLLVITISALLFSAGAARAETGYTVTVLTDTATTLDVVWTWDYHLAPVLSSMLVAPDLSFWTAEVGARYDGQNLLLGGSGQHLVEPHPVIDTAPAPVYFGGLKQAVGSAGQTSAMARHWPDAQFVSPANFLNPHWDHYELILSSDANGAQIELKALHPVPEPSSYAMLVAGLALLGVMRRRS
ncbi:MAG: PEP-CTERM sorting domain-containing protein [Sphingomonadaceae bacterium]